MKKALKTVFLFMILGLCAANAQQTRVTKYNIGSPIHFVAPVFPVGVPPSSEKVRLEYTVLEDGSVERESVHVIETSNVLYNQSAIDALSQFKYKPRTENGKPVKSPRSRTMIEYKINFR